MTIPVKLKEFMQLDNVANKIDQDFLKTIAENVINNAEMDKFSRHEWEEQTKAALKLAKMLIEEKNTPWPKAANVKLPLILNACIEFNALVAPHLIEDNKIVKTQILAKNINPELKKQLELQGDRISTHMSWQNIEQSQHWERDTDKMMMVLPLVGLVYRKSYFDPINKIYDSSFCLPAEIYVNEKIASLGEAERITHEITLSKNQIIERMNAGVYSKIPLSELSLSDADDDNQKVIMEDFLIYEQHTFLDLDDDGYFEPYIVWVHADSKKVLRILARYDEDSIIFNDKDFVGIKPKQYFTDYHFIPAPAGGFHSIGFGQILLHINESANSILNNLLDAGYLNNVQGGLIGADLRMKQDVIKIKHGEYRVIKTANGANLAQNIVPFPSKEPSSTLYNLLGFVVNTGKNIANLSQLLSENSSYANMAPTTALALLEQGMKLYGVIVRRIYISLKHEFRIQYDINKKYLLKSKNYDNLVKLDVIQATDYENDMIAVYPMADPNISTQAHKLLQAQGLLGLLKNEAIAPMLNKEAVLNYYLLAMNVTDVPHLMIDKQQLEQSNPMEMLQAKFIEAQSNLANAKAVESESKAKANQLTSQIDIYKTKLQEAELMLKQHDAFIRDQEMKVKAAVAGGKVSADKLRAIALLDEQERKRIKDEAERLKAVHPDSHQVNIEIAKQ